MLLHLICCLAYLCQRCRSLEHYTRLHQDLYKSNLKYSTSSQIFVNLHCSGLKCIVNKEQLSTRSIGALKMQVKLLLFDLKIMLETMRLQVQNFKKIIFNVFNVPHCSCTHTVESHGYDRKQEFVKLCYESDLQ